MLSRLRASRLSDIAEKLDAGLRLDLEDGVRLFEPIPALVFDPFDLTRIEVRHAGAPRGLAIPHRIGRHAHPKARPETPPPAPPTPSGIDYARLIDTAHQNELAHKVNYAALTSDGDQHEHDEHSEVPDQPDLHTGQELTR